MGLAVIVVFWVDAGAAAARPLPEPPPSGIVVHLFGPGSITSNIVPQTATPSGARLQGAAQTAPAPTTGAILHQMFVTGDPSLPPQAKRARGKTGDGTLQ